MFAPELRLRSLSSVTCALSVSSSRVAYTGCDIAAAGPSSRGDMLDDLESIVNQPPPALGAPAGVSFPILMNCDRTNSSGQLAHLDLGASRHRSTRTVSVDTLDELCQVLAVGESNEVWTPSGSDLRSASSSSSEDEPMASYPPSPGEARRAACPRDGRAHGVTILHAL